jgi:regulatory protein
MRITDIKQQAKRIGRVSVYVDDKYSFSLSKDQLIQHGLSVNQELSASEIAQFKADSSYGKLKDLTLRWLSLRPRSKYEIEQYLAKKTKTKAFLEKLITELEGFGYINDSSFAGSWIRSRKILKPISRYRIKQELLQKRVPYEVIDEALNEESYDDLEAVKQIIARKGQRYSENNKLVAYLARQGFDYDVIRRALED